MAQVNKINSDGTGLRYSKELSIGVVDPSAVWTPLEPNSYSDFGGDTILKARSPINAGRQLKKGVVVDENSSGGFNSDLTQSNLADLLQGFFFADARTKSEFSAVTAVDGTLEKYSGASGLSIYNSGDLVFASGFTNTANNGLKRVTASAATSITVAENITTEASPPSSSKLVQVGYQFAAGDLDVSAAGGAYPTLTTTTKDMTTLGIIPGEWIFIGGDTASLGFSNAANNGYARVLSVTANVMTLDKTQSTMVTEASTTETVQIFFGRVLKNESDTSLQVRSSYQLERQLGAPDDSQPSQIQSEYLVGSVPNDLTFKFDTADKITVDLSFLSTSHEVRSGVTGVKAGTRPSLADSDAFDATNSTSRLKMNVVSTTDSNPTALFGFLLNFDINIKNNLTSDKAIGVLGAFDITAGNFEVGGTMTAYFSDVSAITSIRNNADVTLDFALAQNNAGVVVDVPLISLSGGKLNVEQNKPIEMPLTTPAAEHTTFGHTLLMSFFDYLPTAAM